MGSPSDEAPKKQILDSADSLAIGAFGPADDSHARWDWKSKYGDDANAHIRAESWYLGILLISVPLLMVGLWLELPKHVWHIPDPKYPAIMRYGLAWLGGTLGGTLFDLKWLYHLVPRGYWHLDRRLWRIFIPHVSGALSFAIMAVVSSGFIHIFDRTLVNSNAFIVALAFLTGYFTDRSVGKLAELADSLFGRAAAGSVDGSKPNADIHIKP